MSKYDNGSEEMDVLVVWEIEGRLSFSKHIKIRTWEEL